MESSSEACQRATFPLPVGAQQMNHGNCSIGLHAAMKSPLMTAACTSDTFSEFPTACLRRPYHSSSLDVGRTRRIQARILRSSPGYALGQKRAKICNAVICQVTRLRRECPHETCGPGVRTLVCPWMQRLPLHRCAELCEDTKHHETSRYQLQIAD